MALHLTKTACRSVDRWRKDRQSLVLGREYGSWRAMRLRELSFRETRTARFLFRLGLPVACVRAIPPSMPPSTLAAAGSIPIDVVAISNLLRGGERNDAGTAQANVTLTDLTCTQLRSKGLLAYINARHSHLHGFAWVGKIKIWKRSGATAR